MENKQKPIVIANGFEIDMLDERPRWQRKAHIMTPLNEQYRQMASDMTERLVEEYDCRTPTELNLAKMAALSYVKALDYGERLRDCMDLQFHSTHHNGFYALLGKEVDRSNRLFITAIATLKQFKSPALNINVTAKNAFIAENQQINANKP